MMENVHWKGHACLEIRGSATVCVDPYKISGGDEADVILITHDHYDHLSPDDIKKVRGENTVIVVPESTVELPEGDVRKIRIGETLNLGPVTVKAVPAYNENKKFHPRESGYAGYVIVMDGVTYYHAGDTDFIPEMKDIRADVAFLPVGGTYTMTAKEAVKAVEAVKPKVAVPMHWGTIIGNVGDAELFEKLCPCEVKILRRE